MKKYLLLVLFLSVTGCENGNVVLTKKAIDAEAATNKKRGEARQQLFKECMLLAAKMPRQADDDVSDIVKECASSSYYMTNFIK